MKSPIKLSSNEKIVRSYKLFEGKQSFNAIIVNLFVTNKRIVVYEEIRNFLGLGKKVHEYKVKEVCDIFTNIENKVDLLPSIISLLLTVVLIFIFKDSSVIWPWIVTAVITAALLVYAILRPKSVAVLKIKSKASGVVTTEITSKRTKLLNLNNGIFRYMNVKRCKDFITLQAELGSIIEDIQAGNDVEDLQTTSQSVNTIKEETFDEIPEL